jgi:2-polyprenyl-3-methyl-5-hydroxy-6-metoxy-1,4-benzoquinol methylase
VIQISNAEALQHWASYPRALIEEFGDEGDFARQHLLNPTLFHMLGDVAGKRVMDAGCGQGYLCRLLARRGALVTGVEPTEPMIHYALERERGEKLGITYIQADLSSWSLIDEHYDIAIANMVLMDIPDYQQAILNCVRALKDQGSFIFSLLHPCFEGSDAEYVTHGHLTIAEYFDEQPVKQRFGYFFHRTLSQYLNLVLQAGCQLRQIVEPQLARRLAEQDHKNARNAHVPAFLVVHAVKDNK